MVISELEIRLRADIARLQRDMDSARRVVDTATAGIARAANAAKTALAGMAAGLGGRELIEMTDQYTKFTAQLKLATLSQREYALAYADVKRISTTAQAELGATGVLYARIANGTRELGLAQSQVARITEAVNLALTVSGATGSESASAMLQLSQAFSAGALRGEEFNAVNEAAPRLMKALADGLNVPVGALKKMAEEGKITSASMAKVLGDQKLITDLREGAKQIQTVSGALTVLKNNVMEVVGTKAQTSGFVDATTKGIIALSKSVDALASGLATGAKIGAAYVAALVVAPAVFQVAATALGNLRLQLALARMEMASGASAASLLSAGLGGVAVSAQWASGALGKLAIASNVVFAAFAGWQIGKYLDEQFLQARVAGEVFAGATLEMWEHIKYGGTVAFDALTLAGRNLVQGLQQMFASWFEFMAKGFRLVGFKVNGKEIADEVDAFAGKLRAAADAQGTFASRTAAASAEHERNLKIIRTVTQNRIDAAVAENMLSEATRNTDAKGAAAANGKSARSKEQEAAAKREATAYQNLITSIHEKLAANELEISGYDKLSDSQKLTIKLDAAIGTGKNKLNAEHVKEARALIAKVEAQERAIAAQQLAAKSAEAEAKRDSERYESLRAGTAAIDDRIKQMEREIEMYGLSASAGIEAEKAKLEAKLAAGPATYAELIALDEQIKKLGTLAKLARNKEALDANKQAAEQMAQEQRQMWESVERTAHDTFISIFDSGKSAFDRLRDALKNGLLELLYQMTIKKWIVNIGASMGFSGASSMAQAGDLLSGGTGGGGSGGPLNLVSSAMGAYKAVSMGFAGLSDAVAGGVQTAMSAAGYTPLASQGLATAGGQALTPMASMAGTAAGYLGGAAVGIYGGRAISGGYSAIGGGSGNTAVNVGTAIGAVVGGPIGAAIGGMIGGLANRAFGMKEKEVTSAGMRGTLSGAGATGQNYSNWKQEGGWFRSDKSGTDLSALSDDVVKQFTAGFDTLKLASSSFASSIGVSADSLSSYSKNFDIALGKDQAANEKAITDFFTTVGDEMARRLVPSIDQFSKSGETASATLQRLSDDFRATDAMAQMLGKSALAVFGSTGLESAKAREQLVELAGGINVLTQQASFYSQNFLSEAERIKPVSDALATAMGNLGLAAITTRAQFKEVIDGLNLTTEAGAKQYVAMMGLAEAFALVHPAAQDAATALESYRAAVTEAYNAEADALQQTISKMGSFAASLRSVRESAMLGNLSPLSPQQKYDEAKAQYEAVLAAARGGDATAQSSYQGAFTSFLEASRAVFASSGQYKHDFEYAQAATEEAARWAEAQVDVGQAQLDAIKASVVGIVDVKKEVMSLREALLQYNAAQAEQAVPTAASASAPIPYYPSEGRTNNAALEMKVDTLISELSGLRSDQQQQTGKQITGTAEAMADAAVMISKAVVQPWKFVNDETRVLPE